MKTLQVTLAKDCTFDLSEVTEAQLQALATYCCDPKDGAEFAKNLVSQWSSWPEEKFKIFRSYVLDSVRTPGVIPDWMQHRKFIESMVRDI